MRLPADVILAFILLASLLSSTGFAQSTTSALDQFVGTWKEDESKRSVSGQFLTFRQGTNNVEELRGGDVSPVVQPVVFDGKPHVIDADTEIACTLSPK